MRLPKARIADIVVQNLKAEVLIYDLKTNKAYCLNETAAIVYNHCDGATEFSELKRKYHFTDDLIHFALAELEGGNLIEPAEENYFAGLSRRAVVRRVGLATLAALPLVSGLAAPHAAQASSAALRANGVACSQNSQCANSRCGTNGFGPACCLSDDFAACNISQDCCSGVACTNNVCCQGNGRACDTRASICCAGLRCVAAAGQTNGNCQP